MMNTTAAAPPSAKPAATAWKSPTNADSPPTGPPEALDLKTTPPTVRNHNAEHSRQVRNGSASANQNEAHPQTTPM